MSIVYLVRYNLLSQTNSIIKHSKVMMENSKVCIAEHSFIRSCKLVVQC